MLIEFLGKPIRFMLSSPKQIYLLSGSILLLGFLIDLGCSETNGFSRLGSMLVCLALICIYSNHCLGVQVEILKIFDFEDEYLGEATSFIQAGCFIKEEWITEADLPDELKAIYSQMKRWSPDRTFEEQVDRLLRSCESRISSKAEEARLANVRREMGPVEFLVGLIGTFVWGFGDLFVKLTTFIFPALT